MSDIITLQDCEALYTRFVKYTKTAEQHEFPLLAIINIRLDTTLARLREAGTVEDQKDARAMFRVVLRAIGEEASAYEEANYET